MPRPKIVFFTAYNSYAVDAFELNALDYVLKPVNRARLLKTIGRLEDRIRQEPVKISEDFQIMIRSLPSLRFERGGQPLSSIFWRTSKAQELFAYLLHNRNRLVSKDSLIDLLWPDFNLKKASTHLYNTIYQVRQCLKQGEIDLPEPVNRLAAAGYIFIQQVDTPTDPPGAAASGGSVWLAMN